MVKSKLKENYASFSEFYEIIGNKRNHFITQYNFVVKTILNNTKTFEVLDASCGTGNVISLLSDNLKDISLYGSDICEKFVKITQNKNKNIRNNIKVSEWVNLESTFKNKTFDLVFVLGNSIAHLESMNELKLALKKINSILNNNGVFIFDLRNWNVDIENNLFNAPNPNKNISFNTNLQSNITYTTNYELINKRHTLTHSFFDNNSTIKKIELSFLDISDKEIIDLLISTNFCKIEIINDDSYPYKVIKSYKCR